MQLLTPIQVAAELSDFDESLCVRLLSDLPEELNRQRRKGGAFSEAQCAGAAKQVLESMHTITAELFAAYKGQFSTFQPIPSCFEHYGLDFMVDEDLRVWLLEVNPGPDFKQTGRRLERVVATMLDDSVTVALDRDLGIREKGGEISGDSMERAHSRTRGTGFTAIYADEWSSSKAGDSGMTMF